MQETGLKILLVLLAIKFSFQNFSIKHFPLPLPSQKITLQGKFCG
jgi:hypothetical protein